MQELMQAASFFDNIAVATIPIIVLWSIRLVLLVNYSSNYIHWLTICMCWLCNEKIQRLGYFQRNFRNLPKVSLLYFLEQMFIRVCCEKDYPPEFCCNSLAILLLLWPWRMGHTQAEIDAVFNTHVGADRDEAEGILPEEQQKMLDDLESQRRVCLDCCPTIRFTSV